MNEKVWNIGRMILTGENTINLARGGLELKMRLRVISKRLNSWAMARPHHNINTS
jgi:hypothetical protein